MQIGENNTSLQPIALLISFYILPIPVLTTNNNLHRYINKLTIFLYLLFLSCKILGLRPIKAFLGNPSIQTSNYDLLIPRSYFSAEPTLLSKLSSRQFQIRQSQFFSFLCILKNFMFNLWFPPPPPCHEREVLGISSCHCLKNTSVIKISILWKNKSFLKNIHFYHRNWDIFPNYKYFNKRLLNCTRSHKSDMCIPSKQNFCISLHH